MSTSHKTNHISTTTASITSCTLSIGAPLRLLSALESGSGDDGEPVSRATTSNCCWTESKTCESKRKSRKVPRARSEYGNQAQALAVRWNGASPGGGSRRMRCMSQGGKLESKNGVKENDRRPAATLSCGPDAFAKRRSLVDAHDTRVTNNGQISIRKSRYIKVGVAKDSSVCF